MAAPARLGLRRVNVSQGFHFHYIDGANGDLVSMGELHADFRGEEIVDYRFVAAHADGHIVMSLVEAYRRAALHGTGIMAVDTLGKGRDFQIPDEEFATLQVVYGPGSAIELILAGEEDGPAQNDQEQDAEDDQKNGVMDAKRRVD